MLIIFRALLFRSLRRSILADFSLKWCFTGYPAGDQTITFSQVVLEVMRHLEGAYALIFKSRHYPNELIACKRGSPLLLGVKVSYLKNINYGVAYFKILLVKSLPVE